MTHAGLQQDPSTIRSPELSSARSYGLPRRATRLRLPARVVAILGALDRVARPQRVRRVPARPSSPHSTSTGRRSRNLVVAAGSQEQTADPRAPSANAMFTATRREDARSASPPPCSGMRDRVYERAPRRCPVRAVSSTTLERAEHVPPDARPASRPHRPSGDRFGRPPARISSPTVRELFVEEAGREPLPRTSTR